MNNRFTRREFAKVAALGGAAAAVPLSLPPTLAAKSPNVKVGHTEITWPNDQVEQAIKDVSSLGYYGFEVFGQVLEKWEAQPGGLGRVLNENRLPLVSAYCGFNMTDPAKLKDEMAKMVGWGKLIKKYGGKVSVLGPSSVSRETYNYKDHKNDIIRAVNEVSKALTDIGITACFHQHTGTCVESRDETYATMEAVDTRHVKFGPDIGQLQKGGADPVQVVKDFLPIVNHMHLKDYNGGEYYGGYCPLGMGQVNVPGILKLMDGRKIAGMIMVELDGQHFSPDKKTAPYTPLQTATMARAYLQKQGVKFRS